MPNFIFIMLIVGGVLSHGPALDTVMINRQTRPLVYTLPEDFDYPCIIGVPFKYHWLIGQEVYFITLEGEVFGPWGVVDYEAPEHAGQMRNRRLIADLLCEDDEDNPNSLVHEWGSIAIKSLRR